MFKVPINTRKVNIEARLKRHAKLQDTQPEPLSSNSEERRSVVDLLLSKLQSLFRLDNENPMITRFVRRVVTFSLAFMLVTPLVPLYGITEGYNHGHELDYVGFTEQDTESALASVMTEDGFLLKPALNTVAGDRSTANEIFAYQVEPGDTLSTIAQRFGITKETLMMENDLWDANRLRTGMTLKILPVDGISHVIGKNDTVDGIAKKYKVEADVIVRQNQLEDEDELLVGGALIIPGAKREVKVAAATTAPGNVPSYSAPAATNGRLVWPTLGKAKLTQGFHSGHYALDIANRDKGPIFAATGGKVIKADYGWNGGYGNYIIIDHGNGMQTLYGHNEKLYVSVGQYVEQGQTIAWMGRSGRVYGATGIHVHFEVRINGVKYNPMNFF